MEDKSLKPFADREHIDQKSCPIKLCKYAFAIRATIQMWREWSTQWSDERNRLSVEPTEAILIFICNFKMACAHLYNYAKEENNINEKVKSTLKYDWAKKN
ncbi:hypothetical protein AVEN_103775-1 [Araneus ventricosus]|uniref:Uncharacterized protein n=1 Tax=Araneus ventricosus TaxID=182803 RepID=A0A4Y2HK50_ARAVE|nr:hypothetical protein AVEN_103775-1 [Araneus ventricosus]